MLWSEFSMLNNSEFPVWLIGRNYRESQEEMESVDPMVAALTAHHPEPPQDIKRRASFR